MSYVNCHNSACTVTKQYIGKASRGCSNIQRTLANYINLGKFIEGTFEL
jgi:hypothetical protein